MIVASTTPVCSISFSSTCMYHFLLLGAWGFCALSAVLCICKTLHYKCRGGAYARGGGGRIRGTLQYSQVPGYLHHVSNYASIKHRSMFQYDTVLLASILFPVVLSRLKSTSQEG